MEATRVPRSGRRADPSRRAPVEYKLTNRVEPPLPSSLVRSAPPAKSTRNNAMLVLGAAQASLTLFLTQAIVSVLLASSLGNAVTIRFAFHVVPHVGIAATPSSIISLSTWPAVAAATTTATGALWNLWRRRSNPMFVIGWASGFVMSLELLSIQLGRHLLDPPVVHPWILGQAVAFVAAGALIFVAFRPTLEEATGNPSGNPPMKDPAMNPSAT